jgi:DNA-binding PadR family transcriptional regulator
MSDSQDYNTPISEQVLFILLSLAPNRKHGYAIMKDVEDLSVGKMVLSSSTLYGALGRMQRHGLIMRVEEDDHEEHPGMPRKYYQLSDLGRRVLKTETRRMQTFVALAQQRLGSEKR